MADPTTHTRPAWLILLIIGAVTVVLILGSYLWTQQNEDTQQDKLVDDLCAMTTDC